MLSEQLNFKSNDTFRIVLILVLMEYALRGEIINAKVDPTES